jgi:HK97 family phage portal protein
MNIYNLFKRKGTQPDGTSLIQRRVGETILREINGQITPYVDAKDVYVRKCYMLNDLLFTVIKLIVDKAIIAPWSPYKVVDEEAFKVMKAYQKQLDKPLALTKMKAYALKALEPYQTDEQLNAILRNPNPNSTLSKHHQVLWTLKLITGDYYEKWDSFAGGLNKGKIASLDELPSQYMQILNNRAIPVRVTGYELVNTLSGVQRYTPDEILHEAYANPNWSIDGQQLYGMSPVQALLRRIQRNNSSQIAGIKTFENGGVRGIGYLDMPESITKDDPFGTFNNAQANEIKLKWNELSRGGVNAAGSTIISGYKVGFTEFGLSPHDLDQAIIELADMRVIAAAYGVPSQLLNDPDGKQYANQSEGEKALTLRCALPLLNDREQNFNAKLKTLPAYKNTNIWVSYDMSVYSELDENKKDQVEWLEKAWWLTPNEKRQIMGETVSDDPLMSKFIVPSGNMLLEDIAAEPGADTQAAQDDLNKDGISDY